VKIIDQEWGCAGRSKKERVIEKNPIFSESRDASSRAIKKTEAQSLQLSQGSRGSAAQDGSCAEEEAGAGNQ